MTMTITSSLEEFVFNFTLQLYFGQGYSTHIFIILSMRNSMLNDAIEENNMDESFVRICIYFKSGYVRTNVFLRLVNFRYYS